MLSEDVSSGGDNPVRWTRIQIREITCICHVDLSSPNIWNQIRLAQRFSENNNRVRKKKL